MTQEPSSQRHRDAPPEEFKASQPNPQAGGSDCFDATQYAFFGGNVSTEVELGGLDDEDDGAFDAQEDEEDAEALEGNMPLVSCPHSLKHTKLRCILHNSWYDHRYVWYLCCRKSSFSACLCPFKWYLLFTAIRDSSMTPVSF